MKKSLKWIILSSLVLVVGITTAFSVLAYNGRAIVFDTATVNKAYSNGASVVSGMSVPYSGVNPVKTVYVSNSGNNSNDGSSVDKAVLTLKKAKELVSDFYANGGTGDSFILLADGEHFISSTVEINPSDVKGGTLNIRSVNPNGATLSGSKKVSANKIIEYTDEDLGRVWKIPCTKKINQLYVNDNYAIRARYPDVGEELRLLTWDYVLKKILLDADDIKDFDESVFAGTTILLNLMWAESYVPVKSVIKNDNGTSALEFDSEALQLFLRANPANQDRQSYHFENSKAFLSTYGEFFYDDGEKVVYYIPFPGETLDNTTVRIPYTETLISVEGSIDSKVKGVAFEGLNFKYSANGHIDGKLGNQANKDDGIHKRFAGTIHDGRPVSAVSLQFVEDISFSGNVFSTLGGGAVDFMEGAKNISVQKNVFSAIGGNGVFAGAIGYDPTVLSLDERTFNDGMIINDNYFNDIAWQEYGGCAIILNYACNSEIKFNTISNTKYSGISVGWGWKADFYPFLHSVKVENNRLTNTCSLMSDGGAIYLVGTQPNSTVKNNYIANQFNSVYKFPHHRKDSAQVMWATGGIYLDQSVGGVANDDHVMVENNYIDTNTVDIQEYNTHNAKKKHFVINDTNSKSVYKNTGVREDGFTLIPTAPVLKGAHLVSKDVVTVYGENLGKKWDNGIILKNKDGAYVQLAKSDIVKWTDEYVTFKTANYQSGELYVYGIDGVSNKLAVTMNVDEDYNMYGYFDQKWGGVVGMAKLMTVDKPIDEDSIKASTNLQGYTAKAIYDTYTFTGWSPDPESLDLGTPGNLDQAIQDGLIPHWIQFDLRSVAKIKGFILYARSGVDQPDTRTNFRIIGISRTGVEYTLFEHTGDQEAFPAGGLLYVDVANSEYKDVIFKTFRLEKTNNDYFFVAEVAVI